MISKKRLDQLLQEPLPPTTNALSTTDGDAAFIDVDYEDGIGHIDEYMLRFISDGYYL